MLDFLGSMIGAGIDNKNAKKDRALQLDLAKNTIKYRTEDAKASGIHPLYALGAPSMSYNPVHNGAGSKIAEAGAQANDIITKRMNAKYENELKEKNLENIQADINLKQAQATGVIAEAKRASNMAMMTQTGRMAGNSNALKVGGVNVKEDKSNWSDTQEIEDRYGDPLSWLYGIGVSIADAWETGQQAMEKSRKNAYKPKKRRNYQPGRRW